MVYVNYEFLNKVMQLLKSDFVQIKNQHYEDQYMIEFSIRLREADRINHELQKIETVKLEYKKNP